MGIRIDYLLYGVVYLCPFPCVESVLIWIGVANIHLCVRSLYVVCCSMYGVLRTYYYEEAIGLHVTDGDEVTGRWSQEIQEPRLLCFLVFLFPFTGTFILMTPGNALYWTEYGGLSSIPM